MPLIECPQCHHRVSSVASACPECGSAIADRLWDEMRRGEYYRCGKCNEPVGVQASVCRNCGVPDPRRKRLRLPSRFAVGVGVAAALLVTAVSSSERPTRPDPEVIADTVAAAVDTSTSESISAPPEPILSSRNAGDTAPAPRRVSLPRSSRTSMTPGEFRWTNTWVNVRSGRGVSYPVVVTLDPDEMVVVDNLDAGWWVLVVEGERVGFVANSVLRRTSASQSSP